MNSRIVPRCITLKEAAAYVGLRPRSYIAAARRGVYPDAIPGTRRYDRNAIDAKLDAASGIKEIETNGASKRHVSAYDEWFGNEN